MNSCQNLLFLSSIACQLSQCLTPEEIAKLAADLVLLGDLLADILAHDAACNKETTNEILPDK